MPLLRARDACFAAGDAVAGPVTLEVCAGERVAGVFATPREAAIVAKLAAGIVKATSGCLLIEEYDPRVQPAHCKRIAAFVPHDPLPLDEPGFVRYIAYRAALWGIDPLRAVAHARLLLERLAGVHEAFAYPIAGALIAAPKLVVFDRPQPAHARAIFEAAASCALFSTHTSPVAAQTFSRSLPAAILA